ncbi:cytochrome P450 [Streptomyces sp. NPDC101165]|uniref:cytochrome P450 family protein n=1 Tax=Streptomyces sp. NPDC101165 TaxID=3366119 RepID=UPI00381589FA
MAPPTDRYDLMDPALIKDPFSGFSRIREEKPLARAVLPGIPGTIWLVTRFDDVQAVLGDRRFVNDPAGVPGPGVKNLRAEAVKAAGVPEEYLEFVTRNVVDFDGAEHVRLRRLVSRAFTPRRIAELRPRVEEITRDLLDALPDKARNGVVDLEEHFNFLLPITVICELVGVPEEDRPKWREWSRALVSMKSERVGVAVKEAVAHVRTLIEARRAEPHEDLLTGLIRVQDEDGDRLSDNEMVTMVLTLVMAGHETTAGLLGNGTAALLTHPDQLALLRDDPTLAPQAVQELMRWCSPIQAPRMRYAIEDIEFHGETIRRGEPVIPMIVAANHDPRRFAEPERLDIKRSTDGRKEAHVGFGHGLHYCLGAALAREEAEVALVAVFQRFAELTLAVPAQRLRRVPLPLTWQLVQLPVRLGAVT